MSKLLAPLPKTSPSIQSAAQRALLRILETTIPDRAHVDRAIRRALSEAQLAELPDEFPELVPFVRRYLSLHLEDRERPWLMNSVLEDLEAEAEVSDLGYDSSARMAIATRIPDKLPTAPAPSAATVATVEVPRAPSVPKIALRATRPAVLLVDGDRFKRSALARALVQGRCDVTVLDGGDEAAQAIGSAEPIDVLIIDANAPDASNLLGMLATSRPSTAVLFWTTAPRATAAHLAVVAGVERFHVVSKSALSAEIHAAISSLVDDAI